jgi:hypothetical protein
MNTNLSKLYTNDDEDDDDETSRRPKQAASHPISNYHDIPNPPFVGPGIGHVPSYPDNDCDSVNTEWEMIEDPKQISDLIRNLLRHQHKISNINCVIRYLDVKIHIKKDNTEPNLVSNIKRKINFYMNPPPN